MDDALTPKISEPTVLETTPLQNPVQPPVTDQTKKKKFTAAAIVAVVVFLCIGFLVFRATRIPKPQPVIVPTIVPPTPTPTPMRLPSEIATQSAFLLLESHIASLSGSVQNFVVDDPSLSPPVLDLPLGFQ